MEYVTVVRVLVEGTRAPLAGVHVELYDRDERSEDDLLGHGATNQFGEVMFHYTTRDFADSPTGLDDSGLRLRNRDTVPDLYAVVYDAQGNVVLSTRAAATVNKAPEHLLVLISPDVAASHRLLDGRA